METLEAWATMVRQVLGWLQAQSDLVKGLLNAVTGAVQQLRRLGMALHGRTPLRPSAWSYETLWLELVLDLADTRGMRAVLRRRQRVQFLAADGAVVRELVWGDGEQLVRYSARGARRVGVRAEGSKRAVLLDPNRRPAVGDRLTITSRRTLYDAFRRRDEYCEALLERPTGRLDVTVVFPRGRPPRAAQLVVAATEQVVRTLRAHYSADGRAVLRCRLRKPAAATYSVRWSW